MAEFLGQRRCRRRLPEYAEPAKRHDLTLCPVRTMCPVLTLWPVLTTCRSLTLALKLFRELERLRWLAQRRQST